MKRRSAFTLIELMIAVSIIGVIASVAIPTYQNFVMQAKAVEGPATLGALYRGAASYWDREFGGQGVSGGGYKRCAVGEITMDWSAIVPPLPPTPYKRTYDYAQHEAYRALGFTKSDPTYFSIAYDNVANQLGVGVMDPRGIGMCEVPDGPVYTFFALSDLDGDGLWGTWSLMATARNGQLSRSVGVYAGFQIYGVPEACPMCANGVE